MRVLSIVQFYFPFQDRGGPVVKVRSLAKSLVKRGHQVTVLTADLGLSGVNGFGAKIERCKWGWRWEDEGVEADLPSHARPLSCFHVESRHRRILRCFPQEF